ncbi:hypothetical protein SCACP_35110 [Sporomusa carbonis]|uniref:SWIM zinc finger family protein n=1 Tax=Sporomusa carbonis TaxID=3076075 RepID=UPI003A635ADD
MGRWDYYSYTPSKPREAKGGIKAEGKAAKNWWTKRWISVLESFSLGARLTRGRSYARQGQVLSVEIAKGSVLATVQGSRVKPYKIKINVKTLSDAEWQKALAVLSGQAIYAARLLAGEMPADIEQVFAQAGVSLFPNRENDLETACSCPDWSNPCKHIAAVYYVLGDEFDRDPFLIFKLRGMDREELIRQLGAANDSAMGNPDLDQAEHCEETENGVLSADSNAFWEGRTIPADFLESASIPKLRAAPLRQLGNIPFWRGKESLIKALEPVYIRASGTALAVLEGKKTE